MQALLVKLASWKQKLASGDLQMGPSPQLNYSLLMLLINTLKNYLIIIDKSLPIAE